MLLQTTQSDCLDRDKLGAATDEELPHTGATTTAEGPIVVQNDTLEAHPVCIPPSISMVPLTLFVLHSSTRNFADNVSRQFPLSQEYKKRKVKRLAGLFYQGQRRHSIINLWMI